MNYPPLMIDLSGFLLTAEEKIRLLNPNIVGVILFARNYDNKAQLVDLITSIRALNSHLLICVDHEGGRVQRFRQGFTHLPAMGKLGKLFAKEQKQGLKSAFACGFVMAFELLEVGVDFSFAPVLDIDYKNNEVIADRAFSSDAEAIIQLAKSFIDGVKSAGMASVVKHFPGHGFVDLDSHHTLPIDDRNLAQMSADLSVFEAVLPQAEAVMPAHIIFPNIDNKPAGFSHFWLKKMLREKYHYQGIIISDDLNMQGAVDFAPNITDRVDLALAAGCDMVLICNQNDGDKKVIDNDYPTLSRANKLKAKPKLDKIAYQNYLNQIL